MKDSAKRKFLKSWMRTESSLERAAPPTLISFADMDYWYLAAPLRWQQPGNQGTITVPKGFATDFASIPRVFWSWLPPIGRYGVPAIVHDWHYWNQSTTRD